LSDHWFKGQRLVRHGLICGRKKGRKKARPAAYLNNFFRPLNSGTGICILWIQSLRNRINSSGMKGVTFCQSLKCQPSAPKRSKAYDTLPGIFGACRIKPAAVSKNRRKQNLVHSDNKQTKILNGIAPRFCKTAFQGMQTPP
jgi:hypothetical protein